MTEDQKRNSARLFSEELLPEVELEENTVCKPECVILAEVANINMITWIDI